MNRDNELISISRLSPQNKTSGNLHSFNCKGSNSHAYLPQPIPFNFNFSIKITISLYIYIYLSTTLNNMIVLIVILFLLINNSTTDAKIGINWGRRSPTKLTPSTVVDLFLQNNVSEAKIHSSDDEVIEAFSGTQIGLAITIHNLSDIKSLPKAKEWVQKKIASFPSVDIKYIYVGNQPFAEARFKKTSFSNVVNQLQLIQDALNQCGYGEKVKATFSHPFSGSLKPNISKPSALMPYIRHWGIYRSNGEPKYKIDLSGQGRDIFPTAARGINRMPERWCVYNNDKSDLQKVMQQFTIACDNADCTSLAPGASCSMLGFNENVSYAFNMYFQSKFQAESACDFEGLSQVVANNPSRNGCVFPVEVVRGVLNLQSNSVNKFHETHVVFIFWGFMFLVLCNFL
ncbi:hypothetical protein ACJIZ3_018171 [Penstemon smallii]|uniref:X8 domain-containing protein n=1 Tax=Penstemon smallii TaxID=265156 RepID=A0ABD3SXM7_9LAMI